MAIIEIRCPRCGASCGSENAKHEYRCEHCGTRFHFVDPSRQEVIHITAQNCPACGRPTKSGESYACVECGRTGLCKSCVFGGIPTLDDRGREVIVCRDCYKAFSERKDRAQGLVCEVCGRTSDQTSCTSLTVCFSCGRKVCYDHQDRFKYDGQLWYCQTCAEKWHPDSMRGGPAVCPNCIDVKPHLFGGKTYYCKKCGTQLDKWGDEE